MPAPQARPASNPTPDPHVGLVAGPVHVDRPEWTVASSPGLVAAAVAALLAMLAVLVRAAFGDMDGVLLLVGLVGPVVVVAICAGTQWRSLRNGSDALLRFTVRMSTRRSVSHDLRSDLSRQTLVTGDIVRVVTGPRGAVRAVEVLATLDGPVLRRLERRPVMTPVQWAGVGASAGLLLEAVAVLLP
jgi:hypothetical protein